MAEPLIDPAALAAPLPETLDARLAKLPRTEFGLSDRFLARHGSECLWDESRAGWITWDGARWADSAGRVELLVQSTIRDLYREVNTLPDDKRGEFLKFMYESQRASKQSAVLTLARASLTCTAADLDRDPWLLNCPNGTLDLRTGQLLAHSPARRITKLAGAAFDADAEAPTWNRFIEEITSTPIGGGGFEARPDLARSLQLAIGYSLTGSVREQSLWFLLGGGSNGKGTFIEIIRTILGDYARVVPASLLIAKDREPHPADVATLVGVRFAVVQEVNKGALWDEAKVKALTGGDALTARFMHGNFFEFVPQHKFFVAANHRPVVHDATHSFWRRMQMVPFDRRFDGAQKDPHLLDKLKAELPGILAWCVRGCLAWQRDGLLEAKAAFLAVNAYREDSNGFAAFMDAFTSPNPLAAVRAKTLKGAYEKWATETGEPYLSNKQLWQSLQEYAVAKGFKVAKAMNNGTVYRGLDLFETAADSPMTEETEGNGSDFGISAPTAPIGDLLPGVPSLPLLPSKAG